MADCFVPTSTRVRPPQLLIVNTTDRRRGAELRSVRIAEALAERGWRVDIVSLTAEQTDPTIDAMPLSRRPPDSLGGMSIDVLRPLRRLIKSGGHDLVLANGSATLRYVAVAGRVTGSTRRLGYMTIGDPAYWASTRLARLRLRLLVRSIGWVLAVSHASATQVRSIAGPGLDVEVVHGGVPESFLRIDRPPRKGPLHVVMIGSLSREKDPEAAVQVLAAASADARLRFVGSGPQSQQVLALVDRLGVSDRVELVGSRADVTGDLAWAHVLLLTSRTEGLPGVVLEAAAAGLPTLAFDVGGTAEVVRNGVTGRLLPPGDIEGLARALTEVAATDQLRESMGDNARAMVREQFLLQHAADRYDQALRRRLDHLEEGD